MTPSELPEGVAQYRCTDFHEPSEVVFIPGSHDVWIKVSDLPKLRTHYRQEMREELLGDKAVEAGLAVSHRTPSTDWTRRRLRGEMRAALDKITEADQGGDASGLEHQSQATRVTGGGPEDGSAPETSITEEPCPCPYCRHQRDADPTPVVETEHRVEPLVAVLHEIASRPTVERNPDGVDQAAEAMQLLAREALAQFEEGGEDG